MLTGLLLTGCATTVSNTVHHSIKSSPEKGKNHILVFLPVDITIKELTASGMAEEVPEWTEQGKAMVEKQVNKLIASRPDMVFTPLPDLSPEEHDILDQHVALYHQVAGNALAYGNQEAWKNIRENEGYTLGNGLNFLSDKTKADAALIISGIDLISSGGRQVTAFFGAALGVYVPLGVTVLHAGVVDFKTGHILWMNTSQSESLSLKDDQGAKQMVETVFAGYMGQKK